MLHTKEFPFDKPLVTCALLYYNKDSVKLDSSKVKEDVDTSVPVPSNITAKSITWDSITLGWDAVEGASFYQVEVDENKMWYISTRMVFTKVGLLPDTEHCFRVRTVKENSVGEWSDFVEGETQKESFGHSGWEECPCEAGK